jgi:hypothetical protein
MKTPVGKICFRKREQKKRAKRNGLAWRSEPVEFNERVGFLRSDS